MADIRHLAADGATTLSQQNFGAIASGAAEVDSTMIKFGLENISDHKLGIAPFSGINLTLEFVGDNDGKSFYFTAADAATISRPWGDGALGAPTATLGGLADGGVWGAIGIYGYVVTATNATGETIASAEITANVIDTTQRVTLAWKVVPGATGYKVYRTAVGGAGTYGATSLRSTIVSGGTITFLDNGAAPGAGTPAVVNTTGGAGPAYGTPPAIGSFTQADKIIATSPTGLAIGQEWFYWAVLKVPPGTSSVGNRRAVRVLPKEV